MKSVTLRVIHKQVGGFPNLWVTYRGRTDYRSAYSVSQAGQRVPTKRYRVRYRLDPNGPLEVGLLNTYIQNAVTKMGYTVCYLWRLNASTGDRLSRTLLPWK